MQRLFCSWPSGASNAYLSGRIANHVSTPTPLPSAPPPRPAPRRDPALPGWQQLTPEVRLPLLALLTRMIQHQLPAAAGREVADDSR